MRGFGLDLMMHIPPSPDIRTGFTLERVSLYPHSNGWFNEAAAGYMAHWQVNPPLHSVDAQRSAYATLGRVKHTLEGKGQRVSHPSVLPGRPVFATQTAKITGSGLVAGQMILQPLYNPNAKG